MSCVARLNFSSCYIVGRNYLLAVRKLLCINHLLKREEMRRIRIELPASLGKIETSSAFAVTMPSPIMKRQHSNSVDRYESTYVTTPLQDYA